MSIKNKSNILKIKNFLIIVLLCLISPKLLFSQTPPIPGNWSLTFSDEFNGTQLNPKKWRVGQHWLGFNGISGNSASQITVRNGNVEIKAEKRPFIFAGKNCDYASSEITTFQQFRQKYGYFEARIKYDAVRGTWPAFWTMPDRGDYGEGSSTCESFLKFDVSSFPQSISSALLKIKVTESTYSDNEIDTSDISIHTLLSDDWDETSITWNNKPDFDPAWIALFTGTNNPKMIDEIVEGEYLTIDVTKYIEKKILEDGDVGFAIVDIFMQKYHIKIGSGESAKESDRPHLVIDGTVIYPTDDAFVRGGCNFSNTNFGNETSLEIFDSSGHPLNAHIDKGAMEIDIMESLGIWGDDKTQHALHWDFYGDGHPHTGTEVISITTPSVDGYHIYAMNWQEGHIDFYIDGVKTWEYEDTRVGSVESFILLSLQLGGWNGNENIDDTNLPATMFIDYVKVYENISSDISSK